MIREANFLNKYSLTDYSRFNNLLLLKKHDKQE